MKRDPSLLALSREHHTAPSLANRLKKAVLSRDPLLIKEARGNVVVRFAAELEPHFTEEELTLLPRLATLGEVALVERTLNEHLRMRALVRKLADPTTTHAAGAYLTEFGDLLTAHGLSASASKGRLISSNTPEIRCPIDAIAPIGNRTWNRFRNFGAPPTGDRMIASMSDWLPGPDGHRSASRPLLYAYHQAAPGLARPDRRSQSGQQRGSTGSVQPQPAWLAI